MSQLHCQVDRPERQEAVKQHEKGENREPCAQFYHRYYRLRTYYGSIDIKRERPRENRMTKMPHDDAPFSTPVELILPSTTPGLFHCYWAAKLSS
jgi:hypothetical protein